MNLHVDAPRAPRAVLISRIVFAALAVNFVAPAISYMVAPELALTTLNRINHALGGGPYPFLEGRGVWHMLASGNVMTLGFMCLVLMIDLRRFYPIITPLAFLKGFSALYAAWIATTRHVPVFLAIAVLDGSTTLLMIATATRARRALEPAPSPTSPWWLRLALPGCERIERSLERARAAGIVHRTPTTREILRGVGRMLHRLVFRSETVGTCAAHPIRPTWRARLLAFRAIRIPFLLAEGAIAPLDLSGLASSPDRVIRHLLAAHHDGVQFAYDLELLALWPGKLEELRDATRTIVTGDTPRTRWLRDLVVFEGYHEALLEAAERALRGDALLSASEAEDPDLSLCAFLTWCANVRSGGAGQLAQS